MPQLVEGGKHVFGWSRVGETGRIVVPPDVLAEYCLKERARLILISGSRTSGGFGLGSRERLRGSQLGAVPEVHPGLGEFQAPEGEVIEYRGKSYCWAQLRNGGIVVSPETLSRYGIRVGDRLLVVRGSGLAIGFVVRGPIVEEATKHPELQVFEVEGLEPGPA